jgi:hypothetical protein
MEQLNTKNTLSTKMSSRELGAKLATHLETKTETVRYAHKVMQVLEVIFITIMASVFITALVLSFLWKSIPTQAIPAAWFLLPTSAAFLTAMIGFHALIINAFPPSSFLSIFKNGSPMRLPAQPQGFINGNQANGTAWSMVLVGLIAGTFFAVFTWAAWTVNWTILIPLIKILGIVLGVGIAASILVKLASTVVKSTKR